MRPIRRLILLNQGAGPLFRQLAEGLAPLYPDGGVLLTGYPETLRLANQLGPHLRICSAPAYDRASHVRRALSWLRYLLATTRYVLLAKQGDALLIVSNPPLLGAWIWMLSHFRQVPYAALVYDIHPDVLVRLQVIRDQGVIASTWRVLNSRFYRKARVVITIGQRMARRLQQQVGEDKPAVAVVAPWVDVNLISPLPRDRNAFASHYATEDRLLVLYSGNMGASHDIDSILEAAKLLREDSRVQFLLIGDGEKRADAALFVQRNSLSNIRVLPFQPEERVPYTLSLADISLVALDEGLEDLMLPSKLFSYMAAGSAVVAIANGDSELSDIIEQGNCGLRVSPRQPAALAAAIIQLLLDDERLSTMKANARMLAEQRYSKEAGVATFASVLAAVGMLPSATSASAQVHELHSS
jgi:colanic acid biosynthesis glycosyl transferase WcaI